jgi:hypothetical protein
MAKINDDFIDPAFDPSKFKPAEKDWLNTGVVSPKDVLSRGHNDSQGFWRPDALPGLSPKALGRRTWNPITSELAFNPLEYPPPKFEE